MNHFRILIGIVALLIACLDQSSSNSIDRPYYRYSHSIFKESFTSPSSNGDDMIWMTGDVPGTVEGLTIYGNIVTQLPKLGWTTDYSVQATNPQSGTALVFMSAQSGSNALFALVNAYTGEYRDPNILYMLRDYNPWRVNADGTKILTTDSYREGTIHVMDTNYNSSIEVVSSPNRMWSAVICVVKHVLTYDRSGDSLFEFAPSGNFFIPLANNTINEYATVCDSGPNRYPCDCQFVASHRVTIANFTVWKVSIDAAGTLAMIDKTKRQLYFQPTRSDIQPTVINITNWATNQPSWSLGRIVGLRNSFVVPFSYSQLDVYTLYEPDQWPPIPAPSPPPSDHAHYVFDNSTRLNSSNRFGAMEASRELEYPNRLYSVERSHVLVTDMNTGLLLYTLRPSAQNLHFWCGIATDNLVFWNMVAGRESVYVRVSTAPVEKWYYLELNSTTGGCINAWRTPGFADRQTTKYQFDVDEDTGRIAYFENQGTGVTKVCLLDTHTGEIVTSSEKLFNFTCSQDYLCVLQFHPITKDVLVSSSVPYWQPQFKRLDGRNLNVVEIVSLPHAGRVWKFDRFGSLMYINAPQTKKGPYVFSYVTPNGSAFEPLTPPGALGYYLDGYDLNYWIGSMTITLSGDVLVSDRLIRFRPKHKPQPHASSSSTSSPGPSSTFSSVSSSASSTAASSTQSTALASTAGSSSSRALSSSSSQSITSNVPSDSTGNSDRTSTGSSPLSSSSGWPTGISSTFEVSSSSGTSSGSNYDDISSNSQALSSAAVAGIVIGLIVAVVLCVIAVYAAYSKRYPFLMRALNTSFLQTSDSRSELEYADTQEMIKFAYIARTE